MSDELILGIIGTVGAVLSTVVTTYGALALAAVRKKASIEADAATDRRIIEVALEAIHYAEEQARKAVIGGRTAKLAAAERYARMRLADAGLKLPVDLTGMLEAALSAERSSMAPTPVAA